ncbi:ataxin-3 isoform X3 [Pristis pectinata]|uniref:ataxin-3 isoform X3 n=1 Tax=Pristis pectinata TaxID=685728 RepID=UPI00223C9001|nr:ataxin-3 isoform X3 [Pristis pectinata]
MKRNEQEWQREELPQKNTKYFYSNHQGIWMIVDSFQFKIERAFICNYKEHWFTVRKLGKQWFNLNSLLTGPELISDTYLALFLAQLQQEGYSIFVVRGDLPECEADELLKRMRVVQLERPKLIGEEANQRTEIGQRVQSNDWEQVIDVNKSITNVLDDDEDESLQQALSLSRQHMETEDEEADLRRAIHLSMQGFVQGTESSEVVTSQNETMDTSRTIAAETPTMEELRRRRQAYFERKQLQPENSDHPEKQSCVALKANSANVTEGELPQADVLKPLEAEADNNSKGEGS